MPFVYVLTNPVMPGLVKIGMTDRDDANERITQLYTTGVPVPFKLEFAGRVADAARVESALHTAFHPYRVNPKREFFRIESEQAIAILKLLHIADETNDVERSIVGIDEQSREAQVRATARRKVFNFGEMGVPAGAQIVFTRSDAIATVVDARFVSFGGETLSLSGLTRQLMGTDYYVQPGRYWTYQGRLLADLYEETYGEG